MLQHMPSAIGRMFKNVRSDLSSLMYYDVIFRNIPEAIVLKSPVFEDGGRIPIKYTQDGEKISPPLKWQNIPERAQSLILIIEDVDSPSRLPVTHALVTLQLPFPDNGLTEGAIAKFLGPDPPPGHGPHHYVFQLFALDKMLHVSPGMPKSSIKRSMRNHTVARGNLVGIYERP